MKIAMFGQKRIPSREGGIEIVAEELAVRMVKLGHQVTCYNRSSDRRKKTASCYQGVELKSVPTWKRKGLAAVTSSFFAAVYASMSDAETIHIHAEGPAFFCWIPKLFGKRVIVTVHGLDWQREKWKHGFGAKYIHQGEKMAVRFADEIIVLSRRVQRYFGDTYNRETVFIPNGVSKPELREADLIVKQFGLKKDDYLLFLGRLVPEKGVHRLIDAFKRIKSDKKLVIAGGTSDTDDYVKQLKAAVEGDSRILFTGFVQGKLLEELYSNAYVYVLPSDLEGMPLGLLEAMSYGNCCVVSDIPECTEVVEDKAVIFPRGDTEELAKCLQELCDDHQKVLGRKRFDGDDICRKFDWDEVVKKTLELYQ